MKEENPQAPSKFKVGDVVFVLPSIGKKPDFGWPALNTIHEVDCKVLAVNSNIRNGWVYQLISGNGAGVQAPEHELVAARDRFTYVDSNTYVAAVDTELFPKHTIFLFNGEYLCDDTNGVYISKERLKQLEEVIIKKN